MNSTLVSTSRRVLGLGALAGLLLMAGGVGLQASAEEGKALKPLPIKYPEPTLRGTPEDLPSGPGIEPPPKGDPAPVLAPEGSVNLAAGKPVTSSVKPFTGELSQVTDGKKEAFDTDAVEMRSGSQWIQVDLGAPATIHVIAMWHDHRYVQITRDVILLVSDDPDFKENVHTLYNNDRDDSSKRGVGTDKEYFETKYGKMVDAKGVKGRYVRGYSKGTSLTALNCWQELEVYGIPGQ